MEPKEFLAELQSLIGGEIQAEQFNLSSPPRLNADYRGHFVKVDFVTGGELRIDVNTPPPNRLRIRKEGIVSRALGTLGIVCDHKTGDPEFDETYQIDNASAEWAAQALSPEVRKLLGDLEPFVFFEMTHKDYRCLKGIKLSECLPSDVVSDVDTLVDIADLIQRIADADG